MKAEFGNMLSVNPRRLYIPPSSAKEACETAKLGEAVSNSLVVAYRGTCSFGLKAKALMQRRAQGMLLANSASVDKGGLFAMQVNEEEEKYLKIEAVT